MEWREFFESLAFTGSVLIIGFYVSYYTVHGIAYLIPEGCYLHPVNSSTTPVNTDINATKDLQKIAVDAPIPCPTDNCIVPIIEQQVQPPLIPTVPPLERLIEIIDYIVKSWF